MSHLAEKSNGKVENATEKDKTYEWNIVWRNVLLVAFVHIAGLYGFYLKFFFIPKWQSLVFNILQVMFHGIGVTAGRHRLWSHRAYKAHRAVEIFLVAMAASVYEQSIYLWCRDHRLHHKHSDTDADPYNSRRGFFFCHIGWFFMRKHSDVSTKGATIDLSDLRANPLVMFEHKYSKPLALLFTVALPTFIPWYFWNEQLEVALFYCCYWRLLLILHGTWSVNSFAHLYGYRPYDKHMQPVENPYVSIITGGEGFHNYHHAFPSDYKAAELSGDKRNFTTQFIDTLAKFGLVYDRKTAPEDIITQRVQRTGDSSLLYPRRNLLNFIFIVIGSILIL